MMWTKAFWKGAAERSIKTFFQTLVATATVGIGADVIVGIQDVSWQFIGSASLFAAVLSIATSIGNADFTAGVISDKPVSQGVSPIHRL